MVWPTWAFGLQIEAYTVGGGEGSFGRAVGMETHVVQSILSADAEHAFPGGFVHGGVAGEWKVAIFHRAAKLRDAAVYVEHLSFRPELPHAESPCLAVGAMA